jgi:hypothetical protein
MTKNTKIALGLAGAVALYLLFRKKAPDTTSTSTTDMGKILPDVMPTEGRVSIPSNEKFGNPYESCSFNDGQIVFAEGFTDSKGGVLADISINDDAKPYSCSGKTSLSNLVLLEKMPEAKQPTCFNNGGIKAGGIIRFDNNDTKVECNDGTLQPASSKANRYKGKATLIKANQVTEASKPTGAIIIYT